MAMSCIRSISERPTSTALIATSALTTLALAALGRFRHAPWAYNTALASGGITLLATTHRLLTGATAEQSPQAKKLENLLHNVTDDKTLAWPLTVENCEELIVQFRQPGAEAYNHLWAAPDDLVEHPILGEPQDHTKTENLEALQRYFDISLGISELALHQLRLAYGNDEAIQQQLMQENPTSRLSNALATLNSAYQHLRRFSHTTLAGSMRHHYQQRFADEAVYNGSLADPFYEQGRPQNSWRQHYNAFCEKFAPCKPPLADPAPQPGAVGFHEYQKARGYHVWYQPDSDDKIGEHSDD